MGFEIAVGLVSVSVPLFCVCLGIVFFSGHSPLRDTVHTTALRKGVFHAVDWNLGQ